MFIWFLINDNFFLFFVYCEIIDFVFQIKFHYISISFPGLKTPPEASLQFHHQFSLQEIVFLCQDSSVLFYFSPRDRSQRKATVGGASERRGNNYARVLLWQERVARVEREREQIGNRTCVRFDDIEHQKKTVALKRRPASDVLVGRQRQSIIQSIQGTVTSSPKES